MECIDCDKGGAGSNVYAVLITIMVGVNIVIYGEKLFRFFMKRQKELVLSLKNLSTLLIVTYQIIVDLSGMHQFKGGSGYPSLFRNFVHVLELVIGLDVFELLHLDCVIRNSDYTFKLFATTLAPLGLLALALLWELGYKLWYRSRRSIYNGPFMAYAMITIFFVLPATTQIVAKSFFCQAFDDGAEVESFMKVDMIISCDDARYEFITSYAMIMVAVYPVCCERWLAVFWVEICQMERESIEQQ